MKTTISLLFVILPLSSLLYLLLCFFTPPAAAADCKSLLPAMRKFLSYETEFVHSLLSLGDMGHNEIVGADGMSTPDYNDYFASVLPEGTFAELLRQRGPTRRHVLELAGSGVFLNPQDVDSITGVRLTKKQFADAPPDPRIKRGQVSGDVYRRATATAVSADMKTRGVDQFDLIVIRPIGGLLGPAGSAETDVVAYGAVLHATIKRYARWLAPDGEIFSQLDRNFAQSAAYAQWVATLRQRGFFIREGTTRYSKTPVIRIRVGPAGNAGL